MPADEAAEPESLKVGESVTRALDQLQVGVDAFNKTARGAVSKVRQTIASSSLQPRSRGITQFPPAQETWQGLNLRLSPKQSPKGFFSLIHQGEFRRNSFNLSELVPLGLGKIGVRLEEGILTGFERCFGDLGSNAVG